MALLVAHLAGKDALLALLFHVLRAALTLYALRAALGALEGWVQKHVMAGISGNTLPERKDVFFVAMREIRRFDVPHGIERLNGHGEEAGKTPGAAKAARPAIPDSPASKF